MLYLAILMHGVAFTFVTISLQLEVDRCAGHHRRATAQGLLSVAIQGFGCFLGAELAGAAGARCCPPTVTASARPAAWQPFWTASGGGRRGVWLLTVLLLPRDKPKSTVEKLVVNFTVNRGKCWKRDSGDMRALMCLGSGASWQARSCPEFGSRPEPLAPAQPCDGVWLRVTTILSEVRNKLVAGGWAVVTIAPVESLYSSRSYCRVSQPRTSNC